MPTFADIDQILGTDPRFGSAETIEARNLARLRLGLTVLGRRDDAAAELFGRLAGLDDAALRPIFYDPVLRNAFEDDLAALGERTGEGALKGYLARIRWDGAGPCERLMARPYRPWPDRGVGWVWTEVRPEAADDPLMRRLEELKQGTLDELRETRWISPDDALLDALATGGELLAGLLPHTGAGVFPHISLVGLANGETDDGVLYSLSGGDPLPSALVIAPERLATPWMVAETLLHEGMHLKYFDVLRTGSLIADTAREVEVPWRVTRWSFNRVMAALHVYVHMVLFYAAAAEAPADLRRRFGEPPASEEIGPPTPGSVAAASGGFTTSAERAGYLGRQALLEHPDALTPTGRRFVRWMLDAVQPLLPSAPASEAAVVTEPAASTPPPVEPAGYRRLEPVDVCPMPGQQTLLAVAPGSSRFHWLDEHAWLIYALCDGSPSDVIRQRYRERGGSDEHLAYGVTGLVSAGLVAPVG